MTIVCMTINSSYMQLTTDSYTDKYNNMYIIKTVAEFIVTSQIFYLYIRYACHTLAHCEYTTPCLRVLVRSGYNQFQKLFYCHVNTIPTMVLWFVLHGNGETTFIPVAYSYSMLQVVVKLNMHLHAYDSF